MIVAIFLLFLDPERYLAGMKCPGAIAACLRVFQQPGQQAKTEICMKLSGAPEVRFLSGKNMI